MNSDCPIGLCEGEDEQCPNRGACKRWAKPWPIPYSYDLSKRTLFVTASYPGVRLDISPFEDFDFDLSKEWEDCGFANAVDLPYYYNQSQSALTVVRSLGEFKKAWRLPYTEKLIDGCCCKIVDYSSFQTWYSLPVSKAGWLKPCSLAPEDELPF